jgi:methylisocitrate lyase
MMHSTLTPAEKRATLRDALATGGVLQFPGALNPLSSRLIERHGFDGVYISGAVLSAELGLPDIGLTTLTEVSQRAEQINRVTNLPTIIDADTGFGEPMNVARTVQVMEDAGVSAIQIEDQVNPKRCGHLDGKAIVDRSTALQRIRAAVDARRDSNFVIIARTDSRAVEGFDAAVERAQALVDAGADVLFPEALASLDEYERLCSTITVPVIANMTEFGKTELYHRDQLASAGVKIIIYPVSLLRLAMGAAEMGLRTLKEQGSLQAAVSTMQTRAELYELLNYEWYNRFDSGIYNFSLAEDNHTSREG